MEGHDGVFAPDSQKTFHTKAAKGNSAGLLTITKTVLTMNE